MTTAQITKKDFQELLDFHYTGGPFNGYEALGYIGNPERNYLTDAWVLEAANNLGWSVTDLSEWMTSKLGRWALDAQPMSAEEMRTEMASADLEALFREAVES